MWLTGFDALSLHTMYVDKPMRENVRAQFCVLVKPSCANGYLPDKQEKATQTVLEHAAVLSAEWATA